MMCRTLLLSTLMMILTMSPLLAQVPQSMKYQAVARNNQNGLITNQNVRLRFSILDGSSSGPVEYQETINTPTNDYGLFSVNIGSGVPSQGTFSNINWAGGLKFLRVEIDPQGGTNFQIMGVSQMVSVPYALYAETAGNSSFSEVDGDTTNELQSISLNGSDLTLSQGGGTVTLPGGGGADADSTNELQTLAISGGDLSISNGNTVALPDNDSTNELQTLSLNGNILELSNGGGNITLPGGGGTLDDAYDFGGAGQGRVITADNGEVQIDATAASSIGLRLNHSNTGNNLNAANTSTANTFSTIQATTVANSNQASAIVGSTSGLAYAVSGQVEQNATAFSALYGSNLRTNGGTGTYGVGFNGVAGETNYQSGYGVYGENFDQTAGGGGADLGIGVGGTGYIGVLGEDRYLGAQAGAYGVYANGNMGASGTKSFRIDHPQDPANKYLVHFSIESDEVLNVYRGTITLNQNGEAVVELPGYFDAVNRDCSYQLTPVGEYAELFIKEKVSNNSFTIGGGQPGMEVSWIVYAERNDPYLQQNPQLRENEPVKDERSQGKYLMPYLYDQPESKAMFRSPVEQELQGQQPKLNIKP